MKPRPSAMCLFLIALVLAAVSARPQSKRYVGTQRLRLLPRRRSTTTSPPMPRRATRSRSVEKMAPGSTGAELQRVLHLPHHRLRQAGRLREQGATPELRDAGCEVCHGPGSVHAESGSKADIDAHPNRPDLRDLPHLEPGAGLQLPARSSTAGPTKGEGSNVRQANAVGSSSRWAQPFARRHRRHGHPALRQPDRREVDHAGRHQGLGPDAGRLHLRGHHASHVARRQRHRGAAARSTPKSGCTDVNVHILNPALEVVFTSNQEQAASQALRFHQQTRACSPRSPNR